MIASVSRIAKRPRSNPPPEPLSFESPAALGDGLLRGGYSTVPRCGFTRPRCNGANSALPPASTIMALQRCGYAFSCPNLRKRSKLFWIRACARSNNEFGAPSERPLLNPNAGVISRFVHCMRRGFGRLYRFGLRREHPGIGRLEPIGPPVLVPDNLVRKLAHLRRWNLMAHVFRGSSTLSALSSICRHSSSCTRVGPARKREMSRMSRMANSTAVYKSSSDSSKRGSGN